MKKLFPIFFFLLFIVPCFSATYIFVIRNSDESFNRKYFLNDDGQDVPSNRGTLYIETTLTHYDAGWNALSASVRSNYVVVGRAEIAANKTDKLKDAENGMILFLRGHSYVATNAVVVPSTIVTDVHTNLISLAAASSTNEITGNKIARWIFHKLDIESAGGVVEDTIWNP